MKIEISEEEQKFLERILFQRHKEIKNGTSQIIFPDKEEELIKDILDKLNWKYY